MAFCLQRVTGCSVLLAGVLLADVLSAQKSQTEEKL
jgi:hypothetical protein